MYYTYLLKSKKNNQIYIGSTNDLRRRLREHNEGREFSTKRYLSWEVLYYEAYNNKSLARIREKKLKYNGNALRELKKRVSLFSPKSGAGFTLLEVLIAIFLLTLGIGGVFMLVSQTAASSRLTEARLQAIYLAQEGIELIRNVRDSNFLKIYKGEGTDWLENFPSCEDGCLMDFNDVGPATADAFLKIGNGFYNYETGDGTSFRRIITLYFVDLDSDGPIDKLDVQVEVSWQERGDTHTITIQDSLYKWW